MQFPISGALFSLALVTFSLAAPTSNPDLDYLKNWDGKITPIEELGIAIRDAVPDESHHAVSKRDFLPVYICPGFDWQPDGDKACQRILFPSSNFCWGIASQTATTLSAVGPDPGVWCMLYTGLNCGSGGSDPFSYPGMGRLDGYWSTWNDNTYSMRCWWG